MAKPAEPRLITSEQHLIVNINNACSFDMGPDNEDSSQNVSDFIVNIDSDPNGILSTVDVLNNGTLTAGFTGSQGVATISVTLQDDGGTSFSGDDTSVSQQIQVHVQDYIFLATFELEPCD